MSDGRPTWISQNIPPEVVQSDIFTFAVRLTNGTSIMVNMATDVEIDYENLETQMDRVSGQYVFWANIYSEAKAMVTLLERRIKVRRGVLVEAALKMARDASVKLTEKQVMTVIETDEKLNKWEAKLIVLQKNTGKLWHMVKAIEMKAELLRSRSGFKRQEIDQQSRS